MEKCSSIEQQGDSQKICAEEEEKRIANLEKLKRHLKAALESRDFSALVEVAQDSLKAAESRGQALKGHKSEQEVAYDTRYDVFG